MNDDGFLIPKPPNLDDVLPRIRAEFREMPGLILTAPQAARLWGLDPSLCVALLDALVEQRFLATTSNGSFVRS